MINPDEKDVRVTKALLSQLTFPGMRICKCGVTDLMRSPEKYDCTWSISVVEHINGEIDDRAAVRIMFDGLTKGGRLILTVPTDRVFREEFRRDDPYGLGSRTEANRYFFSYHYDKAAIWQRLVASVGVAPSNVRWFGETSAGWFAEYEARWVRGGYKNMVDDARQMTDHFREYPSWEEMPGAGICGLMFAKNLCAEGGGN